MAVLIDSYSETNVNFFYAVYSTSAIVQIGQSFTGDGINLTSCKLYLKKEGSPTGNVYIKLYAHTGTFGETGTPSGSALATSDPINITTVGASAALHEFTFSGAQQYTMTSGTKYFLVVEFAGASNLRVGGDVSSSAHAGNMATYNGSTWVGHEGQDLAFYVYGTNPISTITGISLVQGIQTITF